MRLVRIRLVLALVATATISLICGGALWDVIAADPFSRAEWLHAVRVAPSIKEGYYTLFSSRDVLPEVEKLLTNDSRLARCFV